MNRRRLIATLTLSFGLVLLAAGSLLAQSGQAESRRGTLPAHGPVRSELRKMPPDSLPERPAKRAIDHVRMDPPVDPSVRPEDIRPANPPTEVNITPEPSGTPAGQPVAPQAPGDFRLFRNTPLAGAPVVGGVTLNALVPIEPSGAANGRVVFYTTNSYAAVSGDRGQTFGYINPFDNFPADGANDTVNGGFGGDQYIYYERTRGLMFWLLQYNPDNTNNTQRLCVARSQADVLNNTWFFYDFTPASFGFTMPPAGASGFWLDFPDLAVSGNFLYLTTNVFPRVLPNPANPCAGTCPTQTCPAGCVSGCTNPCQSVGAAIVRIPLNDLAQGGFINFNFHTDTNSGYRLTQGARETIYWGSHNSNTQVRIYRWAENSGTIFWDDVNHDAFNTGTMAATSPDGNDFAAFADTRILAAYVANDVIGFMWNAAQSNPPSTGFRFPHVQVLRFNESDRRLLSQGQIFNNNHAFLYPSVHPNDRGHLGGTMAWGGGTFFPSALAWIADDFNGGTITPLENLTFATGNAAPNYNRWGDYFATRVNVPYGNTWVGTGFVVNGAGGVTRDPRFVWFGRERDTPPPTNTLFVGIGNLSGYEDGSFAHPYNTVTEGHFAAMPGDTILIGPGNYAETLTFRTPVIINTLGGTATIGRR